MQVQVAAAGWPVIFMLADLSHNLAIDRADLPNEDVIFGSTGAMQEVRRSLNRAAREGLPVLILGESGTGKEVVAKYLHLESNAADAPFVKINCIALTPALLNARLGDNNAKLLEGAQVAAREHRDCRRTTLFLDEIGDMDWKLQQELIQLLSSQYASHPSLRIICSTRIGTDAIVSDHAADLESNRQDGLVRLHLPALRERKQDIPQLCDFLMQKQARRFAKKAHRLTPRTLELLQQWQWPGNLRELENWIARVVILGSQERLAEELRDQAVLDGAPSNLSAFEHDSDKELESALSAASQAGILRILQSHGWSRRRAARELRMSYRALLGRLRDANVPRRRRGHKESPPLR